MGEVATTKDKNEGENKDKGDNNVDPICGCFRTDRGICGAVHGVWLVDILLVEAAEVEDRKCSCVDQGCGA